MTARSTRTASKPATAKASATTPATAEATTPAKAPTACRCGCTQPTVTAKARYLSGHDARHAAAVGHSLHGDIAAIFADAPKLAAKAQAIRDTTDRKAQERVARAAATAAAKAAYADAIATANAS